MCVWVWVCLKVCVWLHASHVSLWLRAASRPGLRIALPVLTLLDGLHYRLLLGRQSEAMGVWGSCRLGRRAARVRAACVPLSGRVSWRYVTLMVQRRSSESSGRRAQTYCAHQCSQCVLVHQCSVCKLVDQVEKETFRQKKSHNGMAYHYSYTN